MYENLAFLMKKENVTQQQIADLLHIRVATVSDKIRGISDFYFGEAVKIRNEFFLQYDIEYIFAKPVEDDEKADEQKEV